MRSYPRLEYDCRQSDPVFSIRFLRQKHREKRRRHAISPVFFGHYHLDISSLAWAVSGMDPNSGTRQGVHTHRVAATRERALVDVPWERPTWSCSTVVIDGKDLLWWHLDVVFCSWSSGGGACYTPKSWAWRVSPRTICNYGTG